MDFILFGIAILLLITSFLVKYKIHFIAFMALIGGLIFYLYSITKRIDINDFYAISDVYPTTNSYLSIFLIIFAIIFILKIIVDEKK